MILEHSHGQLYASPFVPPLIRRELKSSPVHSTKSAGTSSVMSVMQSGPTDCESSRPIVAFVPCYVRTRTNYTPSRRYTSPRLKRSTKTTVAIEDAPETGTRGL